MNFLNTTILLLTTLAIIPILIHLFNRQRVKRIKFSSIRYLKSLQKTRMRRLKIKQLILLLLRTLIILMIVIAFARPATEGSYSSVLGSAAQASVVMLVDNSLSMSTETKEGSLFEFAKHEASKTMDNFEAKDEIALISFNQEPKEETNGFTTNHAFARKMLNAIQPTRIGTDPLKAIDNALELLSKSNNYVKEIYIFSDLAGPGWENFSLKDIPHSKNLKIYVNRLAKDDYENLKVTNVGFGNSLIYPGRPVNISAEIVNESPRRVDNLLISLYVDQKRISQTDVSVSSRSSEKITFSYIFENPGEHEGFVEITDDDLLEDNRDYFSINIPAQIKVLTLYENEGDDYFLKTALKPLPESPSQVVASSEPISRLASLDLNNYDCVILSSSTFLSQANLSKLTSYIKGGGSVMAFIADDNNKVAINEKLLQPAFGCSILGKLEVKQGEGYFRLSSLDYGHPIFSRFGEIEKSYLPDIDFFKVMRVQPPNKGKILASFSTGSPAIIEAAWGNGKILAVFSSIKAEDSDLISHPFFVTFLNRAVEYLAYDLNRLTEKYVTGQPISKTLLNINPQKSVEIVTPSGEKIYPAYNFSGAELNLTIPPIAGNGISEIVVDDQNTEKFAVNFPEYETDGRFLEVGNLKDAMPGAIIIDMHSGSDPGKIIKESRLGKELSKIFIIIALILLAIEMLLARGSAEPAPETK